MVDNPRTQQTQVPDPPRVARPTRHVRHALGVDRDTTVETLTDAFATDPFHVFAFPDPSNPTQARAVEVRRFMAVMFKSHFGLGHTYIAAEGRGAALWEPPDVSAPHEELTELMATEVAPETLATHSEAFGALFEARPNVPPLLPFIARRM